MSEYIVLKRSQLLEISDEIEDWASGSETVEGLQASIYAGVNYLRGCAETAIAVELIPIRATPVFDQQRDRIMEILQNPENSAIRAIDLKDGYDMQQNQDQD